MGALFGPRVAGRDEVGRPTCPECRPSEPLAEAIEPVTGRRVALCHWCGGRWMVGSDGLPERRIAA